MYSLFWKFENEYTMLFENRLAEKYSLAISCENRELKKNICMCKHLAIIHEPAEYDGRSA